MRFRCLENCAMCCSYKVALLPGEIKRIVKKGYRECEFCDDGFLTKKEGYCVFLGKDLKCTIYDERPAFCRSFPFYIEEGGVDVDLSCPGVGQNGEVRVEAHSLPPMPEKGLEFLSGLPRYVSRDEFTKKGLEWCNSLSAGVSMGQIVNSSVEQCRQYGQTFLQDEIFRDFFRITNGMGTHFTRGRWLAKYKFELGDSMFKLSGCVHAFEEGSSGISHGEKEHKIVVDYIRTWFTRSIFYRFCLFTSATLHSPFALAFTFAAELVRKISMVKDALSVHWRKKESSGNDEEMLREAIRVVDGRLRTKCQSARIS